MTTNTPTVPPPQSNFVTVVAWLFIVISGWATLLSVLQNIMSLIVFPHEGPPDSAFADSPALTRFMFTHMELFFRVFLLVCIYTLVCSIGLLKRRNWARRGFIVLLAAAVVYQVAAIAVQSVFLTEWEHGATPADEFGRSLLLMRIFSAAIAIVLVVLFGWMIKKLLSAPIRAEFGA
jgi:hypothetical protein